MQVNVRNQDQVLLELVDDEEHCLQHYDRKTNGWDTLRRTIRC